MGADRAVRERLTQWGRLLLNGRPRTPDSPPRNPLAVAGFVLSLVSLATAPIPLIDVLGMWEQRPEAVLDGIVTASVSSFFLAPVLLWLGLRRADRDRHPWELRGFDGRLAVAGRRIWAVGLLVFVLALIVALDHAFS